MTATEFFKEYPSRETAVQVGEDFFFPEYAGSAHDFAQQRGLQVVTVNRSDVAAKTEATAKKANSKAAKPEATEPEPETAATDEVAAQTEMTHASE